MLLPFSSSWGITLICSVFGVFSQVENHDSGLGPWKYKPQLIILSQHPWFDFWLEHGFSLCHHAQTGSGAQKYLEHEANYSPHLMLKLTIYGVYLHPPYIFMVCCLSTKTILLQHHLVGNIKKCFILKSSLKKACGFYIPFRELSHRILLMIWWRYD
jgi:hypothetical protein